MKRFSITPRRLLFAFVFLLTAALYLDHLGLALEKSYNDDEFQYAHGAWLISQGEVIYRDFFEHHMPLVHQLMAGVFLLLDDHPANILVLRFAMLPFLLAMALAAWRLNAAHGWGILGALAMLMLPTLSVMAVEVRPDPIACALFLWALAIHTVKRFSPRVRGFLSGFFAVAALWGTLKVAYYGMVLPLALVADLVRRRDDKQPPLLSDPWAFLLGGAAAGAPIAAYLTMTGTWDDWIEWTIRWSFVHQWHYPGFPWVRNAVPLLAQSFWVLPFAAIGVASTIRRGRSGKTSPADASNGNVDRLLLAGFATSLASVAWQSAAYLYSFVPLAAMLAIFAARGAAASFAFFSRGDLRRDGRIFAVLVLAALLGMEVQRARSGIAKLRAASNADQHAAWAEVDALTRPGEPVYHLAGGQVTRPSVHYYYFLEAVTRKLKHEEYVNEYPRAIVDTGCIAYMWSNRFNRLALPLQQFIRDNFQAKDQNLWFWGRRFERPISELIEDRFLAVRDGKYFVWPLEAAADLQIDGRPTESIFELTRGEHKVEYAGAATQIDLVWLPADGKPFEPRPDLEPDVRPPPGF